MQQLLHWYRTRVQTQRTTESYTEYQTVSCGGGRRQLQQRTQARYRDATSTETSYYRNTQTYNSAVTYTGGTPSAAVKQNVVDGAYTSEGTTTASGFTVAPGRAGPSRPPGRTLATVREGSRNRPTRR